PKLPSRKRSDAVLKSYSSCYDYRAWSRDGLKQSQFIEDVANRTVSQGAKVPLYSFSGAELTKEILVRLDADNLADYILSLRDDVKKKHTSIESLEQAKTELVKKTETLDEKLKALDEENRLLSAEIERIGACQDQQRETNQFDEQELFEISQMIIDLRDYNENLEQEMVVLREQLKTLQTSTTESPIGDSRANVEAENNFLKFKAKDYDRLESELTLFKAEYDSLTQQKRELAEEVQRAAQYRLRAVELKQNLKEEQRRRELCEEQIEMLVNMYEQQSIELNQLKGQAYTLDRSSRDRLFDESTDDPYGSQTTVTETIIENTLVNTEEHDLIEDRGVVENRETVKESATCPDCAKNLQHIQELNLQIQAQKQRIEELDQSIKDQNQHIEQLKQQTQTTSETKTIAADSTVHQQQILDLRQELAESQRQLQEASEKYATLRETSTADCKELGRLKLKLEQLTSDSPADVSVGQLELLEANEKLNNLQEENEKLRADLTKNKARVVELETQVQSMPSSPNISGGGGTECCVEKAGKITELEQIISGLKDASSKAE
uniref:Uncharacterized protein n=1 Tax=Anopheles maculatus TaxID=74869 RepID=A0A182SMA4_9DIPT